MRRGSIQRGLAAAAALAVLAGVAACGGDDSPRQFLPRVDSREVTVWAVGDAAAGDPATRQVAELVKRGQPDLFLYLGDVYESGTREQFDRYYDPLYGSLARITAPVPGNHEWGNREQGYFPYWRDAKDVEGAIPVWYSLRAGGWQLIGLNSEQPDDPAQLAWLSRAAAGPGTCRLAFMHAPRFSAGENHGDEDDLAPLWDRLRGRAAIVLAAHDHDMQRLRAGDGMTQMVSGAGGHGLYPVDEDDPRLDFANDTDYGALRLTLRPGEARFAFVAASGRVLDSGRIGCRRR